MIGTRNVRKIIAKRRIDEAFKPGFGRRNPKYEYDVFYSGLKHFRTAQDDLFITEQQKQAAAEYDRLELIKAVNEDRSPTIFLPPGFKTLDDLIEFKSRPNKRPRRSA